MKILTALLFLTLLPVSVSAEEGDAEIAQELRNIQLDNYQAEQQRQINWQIQQNIHAIEREQDYQKELRQRPDQTDLRYMGKY